MKPATAFLALPLLLATVIAQGQSPVSSSQAAPPAGSGGASTGLASPEPGVKPPRLIYSPDPAYPRKAHKPRHQDTVVLWLIVGGDGLPRDVNVARTLSPEFDEAAMDAVKKWKFDPATKDGKPVAVKINVEIVFKR